MLPKLERLLCVDDEPDVLLVTQMCLETLTDYEIVTASNGKQAITVAAECKPDLILLDVMMPEMDGPATLKVIRQNPQLAKVPVIFMTARVRPGEIDEYLALGADGVVPKPFDPMLLAQQINEVWEKFHGSASD